MSPLHGVTRRRFSLTVGGAFATFAFAGGCRETAAAPGNDGRLPARPRKGVATTAKSDRLGLDSERDAILRLPPNAAAAPLPLLVYLHGATQRADGMLRRLGAATDTAGVVMLAPDSRAATWDAIRDGFGPDILFLNRALERVFDTVAIDPARVAIGGFSDGASYALSLGMINGDLFTHVIANSPGFVINGAPHGQPKIFVSHGTADQILPIEQCSRMIVPALRGRRYDVTFKEFQGRHEIPTEIAAEGLRWFIDTSH
jgi:phospholipase/carboxylesterase